MKAQLGGAEPPAAVTGPAAETLAVGAAPTEEVVEAVLAEKPSVPPVPPAAPPAGPATQ
jgi:hypothetical protein